MMIIGRMGLIVDTRSYTRSELSIFDHVTPSMRPSPTRSAFRLCLTCLASKSALTHPRCHTVDPFPLTAMSPPLVAPRSLRPKTRRSPKTSADDTNSAPPPTSRWPMSHTSCTALRKSGLWERLLLDIGSITLFSWVQLFLFVLLMRWSRYPFALDTLHGAFVPSRGIHRCGSTSVCITSLQHSKPN